MVPQEYAELFNDSYKKIEEVILAVRSEYANSNYRGSHRYVPTYVVEEVFNMLRDNLKNKQDANLIWPKVEVFTSTNPNVKVFNTDYSKFYKHMRG